MPPFALFAALPLWGVALAAVVGVVVVAIVGLYLLSWHVKRRFEQVVHEAVLGAGSALSGAEVVVHAVTAVAAPAGPSPYDLDEDDEQFCEEMDGQPWEPDEANYYVIDATITPADPTARWDPTGLGVTPADFAPEDPTDISEQMGALHSAERFSGGAFKPAREGQLTGPQRLRLLFGIPKDVRKVKFAVVVTYFGHVELPPPYAGSGNDGRTPVGSGSVGRRETRRGGGLPWDG